jgi:hypothetical protein
MEVLRYECSTCGAIHEGLPDLSFHAPAQYDWLPAPERSAQAVLTTDTCTIRDEAFFIRACLEIPIVGHEATFVWGVWVSLSARNFQRYVDLAGADPPSGEGPYFGWLANRLPNYPDTMNLKTNVHLRAQGQRPLVELEPTDHPLAIHQRKGIQVLTLLELLGDRLHGASTVQAAGVKSG